MADFFTPEERALVHRYLNSRLTSSDTRRLHAAFILPSVLFCLYALYNRDFIAAFIAYIALLGVALVYLSQSSRNVPILRSVLEKYEAKVGTVQSVAEGKSN